VKKNKRTVRHSSADLTARVERGATESDLDTVKTLTEAEVEAAVATDPDEAETEIDSSKAVFHPAARKKTMTMRLDADVLAFFKDQGRGYQTKINTALRAYMDHARKSPVRAAQSGGTKARESS
jgi:uncharacterized protein (DUF4415 family)